MSELVKLERRGAVALITIDRPERLNALDAATLADLDARVSEAERDDAIRVIVFTGAGDRAFVAGGDIAELNTRQGLAALFRFRRAPARRVPPYRDAATSRPSPRSTAGRSAAARSCCSAPTSASSPRRRSSACRKSSLGLFPGAGGSQRLMRQIPLCKAKEMMFVGDRITAAEAERLGLVNRVVAGRRR